MFHAVSPKFAIPSIPVLSCDKALGLSRALSATESKNASLCIRLGDARIFEHVRVDYLCGAHSQTTKAAASKFSNWFSAQVWVHDWSLALNSGRKNVCKRVKVTLTKNP